MAVNSGTAALHCIVRGLGLGAGDEVITTPFSFVASANCLLYEQVKPIFVDVEEETFGIDPKLVEAAIGPATKALLPVHVFGQCCQMDALMEIADRHGLPVIEDACEATLARHHGQMAGTIGKASAFGFYPNKQMTTGEGGMILTDDEALYRLCRSLRNQGRSEDGQWLSHERLGFNYRIHELTAALGVVQTEKLPALVAERQRLALAYQERLRLIAGIRLPETAEGNTHSWFVYPIRVEASRRNELISQLAAHGIQSKAYFYPCIHLQQFYRKKFGFEEGMFPVAERLSKEILILPFFPGLKEEQMDRVARVLSKLI